MITSDDMQVIGRAVEAMEQIAGREKAYDFGIDVLDNIEQRHHGGLYLLVCRVMRRKS